MERWEDEVEKAVVAGEREFGRLDAHQTIKHNLTRRCEEMLVEQLQPLALEEQPGIWAEGDQPGKPLE